MPENPEMMILNPAAVEGWRLYKGDALTMLREQVEPEIVDLVITDPPYDDLEKHRKIGTTTRLKKAWFPTLSREEILDVLTECHRVLKDDTHCYVMCNYEAIFDMKEIGENAGFEFVQMLVWDKVKIGMGYHYRSRCEFFLMFTKGDLAPNFPDLPDFITVPRIHKGYPTEKPKDLFTSMIVNSSLSGEVVLDPFCGSGSVGVAALAHGRRFVGCDISEEAIALARSRLLEDSVYGQDGARCEVPTSEDTR